MVNFRKILGLAGTVLVFTGLAYGQTFTCASTAATAGVSGAVPAATVTAPIILRVEDTTALVSDLTFFCAAGNSLSAGALSITLSAPVTSQAIKVTGGNSDATLQVISGGATTTYPGTVSGTTVTFSSINLPAAAYQIRISNIRVNASTVPVGTQVTEQVLLENQGVVSYFVPSTQVGLVNQGFAVPALEKASALGTNTNPVNYVVCVGNPATGVTPQSFGITVAELFGGAFKTQTGTTTLNGGNCGTGTGCSSTNGEQGSYPAGPNAAGSVGGATHGTRIQFAFANVPANVTLYVPNSITNGTLVASLTTSATGAFSQVAANPPTGTGVNVPPSAAPVTIASGSGTAVYEITATDNTVQNESFTVTGYAIAAPNFSTTATTAMTVTVSPAPTASSTVTDIPAFATTTNTAITLSAFNLCQTTILFPYVANQLGFDVGFAISNTASDPFSKSITASSAGATGSCNLNFYGSGAPTASTGVTPPSPFPASLAPGNTGVFLLSSAAPGFSGYMIAQCSFLYGHGFAYIIDNFGMPNGTAEGYLGLVMPYTLNSRAAVAGTFGAETLGN